MTAFCVSLTHIQNGYCISFYRLLLGVILVFIQQEIASIIVPIDARQIKAHCLCVYMYITAVFDSYLLCLRFVLYEHSSCKGSYSSVSSLSHNVVLATSSSKLPNDSV